MGVRSVDIRDVPGVSAVLRARVGAAQSGRQDPAGPLPHAPLLLPLPQEPTTVQGKRRNAQLRPTLQ